MKQKKVAIDELLTFEKRKSDQTRFLLVDGHGLLFQMFFGFPNKLKNEDGKVISGTLGFVSTLLKVVKNLDITHCLVVFDKEQKLNNANIDNNYKANRPDWSEVAEEDNPFSQLDDILLVLDHLKINHIFSDFGFEADDYINQYKKESGLDFNQTFILSKDTDFYQIVDNNTFLINYNGKNTKILSPESIYNKIGIYPKHYIFFKALTGDSADNIKGIDGVGKVTAKKIIDQYPNLEKLYQNLANLPKSLFLKLEGNKDKLKLNQNLISLETSSLIKTLPKEMLSIPLLDNKNGYQTLKELNIV